MSLLSQSRASIGLDAIGWPPLGFDLGTLFGAPVTAVWLEIGFGAGEHLVGQAEAHPHIGMLGADPFVNGVASLLSAIAERELESRVRVFQGDSTLLLDRLPEASIARAFMLFPDPWPKTRHKDRRLLSAPLLDKIAAALQDGAEFRFASDIADYTEAAVALTKRHAAFELGRCFTSETRDTVLDWPATRYEGKAGREHRPCTFLTFERRAR